MTVLSLLPYKESSSTFPEVNNSYSRMSEQQENNNLSTEKSLSTNSKSLSNNYLSPYFPKIVFGCTNNLVTNKKLITVCMHGDESCGMVAVNELIEERFFSNTFNSKEFISSRVTILLANPKGVLENKRFIDVNLNRIFHETRLRKMSKDLSIETDSVKNSCLKKHYELTQVQQVADEIAECDEYIDIHSTSAKSYPFALPALDAESEKFAESFGVDFVIEKLVKSVHGTSIGWATALNKKAVCFECGQHEDRCTVEVAKKIIRRFITGSVKETAKAVLTCGSNEVIRKGFKYVKGRGPPRAFEKVAHNELLAIDEEVGEIRCSNPKGSFIIMPTANPILGEEAWFWGELKEIRNEKKDLEKIELTLEKQHPISESMVLSKIYNILFMLGLKNLIIFQIFFYLKFKYF